LPLLFVAIGFALSTRGAICPSGGAWFFSVVALRRECKSHPSCLDKKALGKGRNILWDTIVVNMLLHFVDKFGGKFDRDGYILGVKFVITNLNFIGINQVLGERCKELKN
jgi:hypothetical protein